MNDIKINISSKETKKNKKKQSNSNLWNLFDNEINKLEINNPIECIFRLEGEREMCECCNSQLYISEEGFLVCKKLIF